MPEKAGFCAKKQVISLNQKCYMCDTVQTFHDFAIKLKLSFKLAVIDSNREVLFSLMGVPLCKWRTLKTQYIRIHP
jgi:hypothetical protein